MSTVWMFTPSLLWTVVVFLNHCQGYINGLEINVKNNAIFFKLKKRVNIFVAVYLLFDQYYEDIWLLGIIN